MTFERTNDADLIQNTIRAAWDRPEMLCQGASLDRITLSADAQYFAGRDGAEVTALFVGYQQSPVCMDIHCCLTPACRGRKAVEAVREFFAWLPAVTNYRKLIGSIPGYNRPMLFVALRAGMKVLAINRESTMRNGKLADQFIVERRLA